MVIEKFDIGGELIKKVDIGDFSELRRFVGLVLHFQQLQSVFSYYDEKKHFALIEDVIGEGKTVRRFLPKDMEFFGVLVSRENDELKPIQGIEDMQNKMARFFNNSKKFPIGQTAKIAFRFEELYGIPEEPMHATAIFKNDDGTFIFYDPNMKNKFSGENPGIKMDKALDVAKYIFNDFYGLYNVNMKNSVEYIFNFDFMGFEIK